MASVVISGDTSGTVTLSAPAVAGSSTQTLVNVTGTLAPIVSGTAVASTSGTTVDFTGIPSWVKRITIMLNGVSTNGTSNLLVQIGSGSFVTSGYTGYVFLGVTARSAMSTGFMVTALVAADSVLSSAITLVLCESNTWIESAIIGDGSASVLGSSGSSGKLALGGALDRVRITTVAGSTFDAGSINIMYE